MAHPQATLAFLDPAVLRRPRTLDCQRALVEGF